MAIQSMTGFGAARGIAPGWRLKVEIKAVNHRGLDARVHAPREWAWLEARIVRRLKERLRRGRVNVSLELSPDQGDGPGGLTLLDEEAFGAVARRLKGLAISHGLAADVRLSEVLVYREVFERQAADLEIEDEAPFMAVVDEAIDAFVASRRQEGQAIAADLTGHLEALDELLAHVRRRRPELVEGFRGRLTERLEELAQAHGVELEPERVIQEVLLFAERSDIAEEIQRAGAHIERLSELLERPEGPHGKQLDFYLQEMIRETNTMASKSNFAELTDLVVSMKSHVEQMREQVANVE